MAAELVARCEAGEIFPFPGIKTEQLAQMRDDWERDQPYGINIDEVIARFQNEGMRVIFTKDPTSGNILVLPANSSDIESDSILPRLLSVDAITDPTLLELCVAEYLHKAQKSAT